MDGIWAGCLKPGQGTVAELEGGSSEAATGSRPHF